MSRTNQLTTALGCVFFSACSQQLFLPFELDPRDALIIAAGDSELQHLEVQHAGEGSAASLSLEEELPWVVLWRIRRDDFLPIRDGPQVDFASLSVSRAGSGPSCSCVAPAVSTPAPLVPGQSCSLPGFVEGSVYRLESRELQATTNDEVSDRFGAEIVVDWPGTCVQTKAPSSATSLKTCPIAPEALTVHPQRIAADDRLVLGVAPSMAVAVSDTLDAISFELPGAGTAEDLEPLGTDGAESRFVSFSRLDETAWATLVELSQAGGSEALSARVTPFELPNVRELIVRDVLAGSFDRFEILGTTGGEFGEARAQRCSVDASGRIVCSELELGTCRSPGEGFASAKLLPDGTTVAFSDRGMLLGKASPAAEWTCGPAVSGLQATVDNRLIDFSGPESFELSQSHIVGCFQTESPHVTPSVAIASAPFSALSFSASGKLVQPLTVTWQLSKVLPGRCAEIMSTPSGHFGVLVTDAPGAVQAQAVELPRSTLVEIDPSSGALIATHESFGETASAGIAPIGRPIVHGVERPSSGQLVFLGADGQLSETTTSAVRKLYGPTRFSTAAVTAVASAVDTLAVVARGVRYSVRAASEITECSDLEVSSSTIAGLPVESRAVALCHGIDARWLLSVDAQDGSHALIELDDWAIAGHHETEQAVVSLTHLGGNAFALVYDSGALGLFLDGRIEPIPAENRWLDVAADDDRIAWLGGNDALGRLFLTEDGTAQFESDWYERLAPPQWRLDPNTHAELSRLRRHALAAWSVGAEVKVQRQAETGFVRHAVHGLVSPGPGGLSWAEYDESNSSIRGFGDERFLSVRALESAGLTFFVGEGVEGLPYGEPWGVASRRNISLVGTRYGQIYALLAE